MKKLITMVAAFLLVGGTAWSATKGSCESAAISLASSQKVTLVEEYDKDMGGGTGMGVAYYKVTLSKYQAYTIWITGGQTEDLSLSVDVSFDLEDWPMAGFEYDARPDNSTQMAYMYADSWDEDDKNSYTFYVCVSGEIGETCNLYFANGIRSFVQEGEDGNPRRITATEAMQSEIRTQIESSFYYSLHVEAGRKYRVWGVGGVEKVRIVTDDGVQMLVEEDPFYDEYFEQIFQNKAPKANGVAYLLYPQETGDLIFSVDNQPGSYINQPFGVAYMVFHRSSPEEHMSRFKKNVVLSAANKYAADVVPGRVVADAVTYYDPVIDETLAKVYLKRGERWVFETVGATKPLMMRLYDAAGNVLVENDRIGPTTYDVRTAGQAPADGWFYVGVCDPTLDYMDEPGPGTVRLTARRAEDYTDPTESDEFDSGDDTYAGATTITAYPGTLADATTFAENLPGNGPHILSAGDWYDWYRFAGRKGVTYALKARFATSATTYHHLSAQVYKMVNGAASVVTGVTGSLTPDEADDGTLPLNFTADADAVYYVGISVKEGVGLDYPAYSLHAMGFYTGIDLGLVTVNTKGAAGEWTIKGSDTRYPAGATVISVAGSPVIVNFMTVAGFKAPAAKTVTPGVWKTEADIKVINVNYTDTHDPADNVVAGYTMLTPTATEAVDPRTLWKDDPADHFVFRAVEGVCYNFVLEDTTSEGDGDAVFAVYTEKNLTTPIAGLSELTELKKQKFTGDLLHLVKVTHRKGGTLDSSYALHYNAANIGVVGFASEKITVTKNDAYADLTVVRTSSEGALRVCYATVAGTAKPGEDYFPTSAVETLAWEDGDASSRQIRVKLIPDLEPTWNVDKKFSVKLWPISEDAVLDDEYQAILATIGGRTGTATVTITPDAEKNPGTVSLVNQPLTVTAGDDLVLRLSRQGGSDGSVAVALYTNPGTAVAGAKGDYETLTYTVVQWNEGETGEKTVTFKTHDRRAASAKTVTLGLLAVNQDYRSAGYGDYRKCLLPQMATTSATISIVSGVASHTTAALAGAAASGISFVTPMGSWLVDESDTLRSEALNAGASARVQFSVNGPGFFVVEPQILGGTGKALLRYLVSGGKVIDISEGGRQVITVPAGAKSVLFDITSSEKGCYAAFNRLENGLPFKWIPLSSIRAVYPGSGAVIHGEPALNPQAKLYGETTDYAFSWTKPEGKESENLWYRVKVGTSAASFPYTVTDADTVEYLTTDPSWTPQIKNLVAKKAAGTTFRLYWTVECAYSTDPDPDFSKLDWLTAPNAWSFSLLSPNSPSTAVSAGNPTPVHGDVKVEPETIVLTEGVYYSASLSASEGKATIAGCVGGRLPPGLTVSGMKLAGVPSQAGDYEAEVEVAVGSAYAATKHMTFKVQPMESAAGTFVAYLHDANGSSREAYLRNGALSMTVGANGSVAATMIFGPGRLSFNSTKGYDSVEEVEVAGETTRTFRLKVSNAAKKIGGATCTDTMELEVTGESVEDALQLRKGAGKVAISIYLADKQGLPTERTFTGLLTRDDSASETFRAELAPYVGYYTVALVPQGPVAGLPRGNGVLTLTLDENGRTRMAGTLADGTAYTCAAYANLSADGVAVPFFASAANYSVGGTMTLVDGGEATYVDSLGELSWSKDGAGSTPDNAGFTMALNPAGGYYDTIVNLERYYLDRAFVAEADSLSGLPTNLLPSGYTYMAETTPHDVNVNVWGNTVAPEKGVWVKDDANPSRYDLAKCVNLWNVTASFARGSGLVSGSFNAVSDNGTTQAYVGVCTHTGVLLMNRDASAPLDEDVWTAGHYLLPTKTKWQISMPFNIKAVRVDRDWSEAPVPKAK